MDLWRRLLTSVEEEFDGEDGGSVGSDIGVASVGGGSVYKLGGMM